MRLAGALALITLWACENPAAGAYARRITVPGDLIGGPGAIGAVGDYLIGNHKFKVIIQDKGWSRGFGIFGGGIIDADVVRASGEGHDEFGELFPALLLQAFDVADQTVVDPQGRSTDYAGIEVLSDGSDGGAARIVTRARGGDFLTMIGLLLDFALPESSLRYETEYVVAPGSRHVKIIGRLINEGLTPISLPDPSVASFLEDYGVANLELPLGDVTLFGVGNEVFAPGAVMRVGDPPPACAAPCPKPVGFDLRFAMEAAYQVPITPTPPPGDPIEFLVPGLVVDLVATAGGPQVSYGFAAGESERNYVWSHRDRYEVNNEVKVTKHSMLAPFIVSSFTGVYYNLPPPAIGPGETYEYTRYFIVGTGDVASIRDEVYAIRRAELGAKAPQVSHLRGRVIDARTGSPVHEAWVHILDDKGRPFSQAQVNDEGWFLMKLEHGRYAYRITAPGRHPFPDRSALRFFDLTGNRLLHIEIPPAAEIVVRVADSAGKALPAKVSLVARYEPEFDGADPMDFLFDMSLNEGRRSTDLSWRLPAGQRTRRFVEKTFYTYNGMAHAAVRPSCLGERCRDYDVVVSRGPEYTLATISGVRLNPGERREVSAVLRRVVDTAHWVATDLHVHAVGSADSDVPNDVRVMSAAGEGVEIPVATDHNFITDYRPAIAALGLYDWVGSIVGVELSTLEMGHFNGFPLTLDIGAPSHFPYVAACAGATKVNRTAFDWVECTPGELFNGLRALGSLGPDRTVVQVNHPRDTILGYFNQYGLNPFSATPEAPPGGFVPQDRVPGQYSPESFSYDFDAIEVANGKRLDQFHAFRLPMDAPQDAYDAVRSCPDGHPENERGQVLYDKSGRVAYPGAVDDWLHLLNAGFTYTATGNSDSHGHASDEMGIPRTYLYIEPFADGKPRDGAPAAISDLDVVHAIKGHRALVSNGPFLTMSVLTDATGGGTAEWPIGSTVAYAADARGASVRIFFHLKSAPWIKVDKILLYANGKVVDAIGVPAGAHDDFPVTRTYPNAAFLAVYPNGFDRDMVLVAEAVGATSMFPVVTPKEEPPTNISQALSALAEGLGVSDLGTGDGITAPDYVQTVRPYALTNPIWLNLDASGTVSRPTWNAPGNEPGPGAAPACPAINTIVSKRWLPRVFERPRGGAHYQPADIRKTFHAQCSH